MQFVDSIPASRKPGEAPLKWAQEAAALRANPGMWAHLTNRHSRNAAGAMASQIRTGMYPAFAPAGHFEAVSRTVDGEYRVYVRYLGAQQ